MLTQDAFVARQREMQEQARAAEEGRRKNVGLFERMWLTLGADCIRAAGSQHQVEVAEALGIATSRWGRLLDMEQQVIREEQQRASRPKNRPTELTDDTLPDRTLEKRNADWQEQTKHMRAAHEELRKLAEKERKELESFVTKRR
jgi:flagellar motility protein MotE (MotC chaperone)